MTLLELSDYCALWHEICHFSQDFDMYSPSIIAYSTYNDSLDYWSQFLTDMLESWILDQSQWRNFDSNEEYSRGDFLKCKTTVTDVIVIIIPLEQG